MTKSTNNLYYGTYLQLQSLLNTQQPESGKYGDAAHDEMLFIITHQSYELWFKQILHELRSILELFNHVPLSEKNLNIIVARLERIICIQKVINQQIGILETMTPLDFLDFRDYLIPASGFQSAQFREIELRLGLPAQQQQIAYGRLTETDRNHLIAVAGEDSLFNHLDAWLSRIPFLDFSGFNFWESYRSAVTNMLAHDARTIRHNALLNDAEKKLQIEALDSTRQSFQCLFDTDLYAKYQSEDKFRLSHKATLASLFIRLYQDEPLLQLPFKFLTCLMNIDQQFTAWRSGHVLMVQRMLGTKIGTGGSSGHDYLNATISGKRFFADLFNLSTYLIPRSKLPELPEALHRNLGFHIDRH